MHAPIISYLTSRYAPVCIVLVILSMRMFLDTIWRSGEISEIGMQDYNSESSEFIIRQ
jgi:hypothetical protein